MKYLEDFKKFIEIINFYKLSKYYLFAILYLVNFFFEAINLILIVPLLKIISDGTYIAKYKFYYQSTVNLSQNDLIFLSVLIFMAINILRFFYFIFSSNIQKKFLSVVRETVASKLFSSYTKKNYAFHLSNNSSKLSSNILESNYFVVISEAYMTILNESLIILGFLIILFLYNPIITTIALISIVLGFLFIYFLVRSKHEYWGEVRKASHSSFLNQIKQGFGSLKELKILGRIDETIKKFNYYNNLHSIASYKNSFYNSLPKIFFEFAGVIILFLLIIFMVINNYDPILIFSTTSLYILALYRLLPAASKLSVSFQHLKFYNSVLNNLYADTILKKNETEIEYDNYKSSEQIIFKNNILLKNIFFSYKNSKSNTLNNFSFEFLKGQSYGIYGSSGVGKTTLVNIILGLLEPKNGMILVDGVKIEKKNIRSWQNLIGYIPQDIYLNDDTICNNIALGVSENNINHNIIDEVIKISKLDKFINSLPSGKDTIIGELGDLISGGQKQRIGIARALYRDPQILIFDEATSALDFDLEDKILKEILLAKKDKTIIFISHRFKKVENQIKLYRFSNDGLIEEK
jgi:ABC-type multidrug transport system fused ATPase/permease subunit